MIKDYFTVNFLEYYNLRLVRGDSKLFMLICDNERLLMSVGAEQNSEILEVVGQHNLGEFSRQCSSIRFNSYRNRINYCIFSIMRRKDGSITFRAVSNWPQA